ncbi:hypothetical protein CBS101457_000035 [Exobasidium rhododendri]|nr:hypothetical protein CBS101457_000035 [Exobasidium rhododendri]
MEDNNATPSSSSRNTARSEDERFRRDPEYLLQYGLRLLDEAATHKIMLIEAAEKINAQGAAEEMRAKGHGWTRSGNDDVPESFTSIEERRALTTVYEKLLELNKEYIVEINNYWERLTESVKAAMGRKFHGEDFILQNRIMNLLGVLSQMKSNLAHSPHTHFAEIDGQSFLHGRSGGSIEAMQKLQSDKSNTEAFLKNLRETAVRESAVQMQQKALMKSRGK